MLHNAEIHCEKLKFGFYNFYEIIFITKWILRLSFFENVHIILQKISAESYT